MKKNVKVLAAATALLAMGLSAFAETTISAHNRVRSGLVTIAAPKDEKTSVGPGMPSGENKVMTLIEERAQVEVTSDRVDAMVKTVANLNLDASGTDPVLKLGEDGYQATDWYVELRPFSGKWDILTVGFHDSIMTPGSALPVFDDNLSGGNLGSDLVLCLRPVKGLRICAGADFELDLGKDQAVPKINVGADYAYDKLGAVGVTFRNVAGKTGDNWDAVIGAFVAGKILNNDDHLLNANLGYTHNAEADTKVGGDIISLGVVYGNKKIGFGTGFDFVTSFGNTTTAYDVYLGVAPKQYLSKNLAVGFAYKMNADYDNEIASLHTVAPFVDLTVGKHSFEFCAAYTYAGPNKTHMVTFPCWWRYDF